MNVSLPTATTNRAKSSGSCPGGYNDDEGFPSLNILYDGDRDNQLTEDGRLAGDFTTGQLMYSGRREWYFDPAPPEQWENAPRHPHPRASVKYRERS